MECIRSNDNNERQDDKKGLGVRRIAELNPNLAFNAGAAASENIYLPLLVLAHRYFRRWLYGVKHLIICVASSHTRHSTNSIRKSEKAHCQRMNPIFFGPPFRLCAVCVCVCFRCGWRYLEQTTANRRRPSSSANMDGIMVMAYGCVYENENIRFLLSFSRPFRLTLTPLDKQRRSDTQHTQGLELTVLTVAFQTTTMTHYLLSFVSAARERATSHSIRTLDVITRIIYWPN